MGGGASGEVLAGIGVGSPVAGRRPYNSAIAGRKHNAPQRRRQLADVAIELLGAGGARGLSHPKVDAAAGVAPGTTSFYFRTRQALLLGMAHRLTELDVEDLSRLTELTSDQTGQFTGTAGLAELVMYSRTEPFLTRTKARYELMLQAGRDAEVMAVLQRSVDNFYRLAHDVVVRWHPAEDRPSAPVIEHQARAALALINGVMLSFVAGRPIVESAAALQCLLDGLIAGLSESITEPGAPGAPDP